jgi:hypothetical protein
VYLSAGSEEGKLIVLLEGILLLHHREFSSLQTEKVSRNLQHKGNGERGLIHVSADAIS